MFDRLCSEGTIPAKYLSTWGDTFCGKTASGEDVMVRYPRKGHGLSVEVGTTVVGKGLSKDNAAALASKHVVTSPWRSELPSECKKMCEAEYVLKSPGEGGKQKVVTPSGLVVGWVMPKSGKYTANLFTGRPDLPGTLHDTPDAAALATMTAWLTKHGKMTESSDDPPTASELYRKMKHLPYRQGGIDILTKAGFRRALAGQTYETWEGTTVDGFKQVYQWIAQTASGLGTKAFGWSRVSSDAAESSVRERNSTLYESLDEGTTGKCKECGRRDELLNGRCRSCAHAADDKEQSVDREDDKEKDESLAEPTDPEYTTAVEMLNASLRKGTVRD